MSVVIIIPALNPDKRLIDLVSALTAKIPVIIVDDGSSADSRSIFEVLEKQYSCYVYQHRRNAGKGAALKTGFSAALSMFPDAVGFVTADADGQHSPTCILRVAEALEKDSGSVHLGTRCFSGAGVPFKSRWGNRVTAKVFRACTRIKCSDTQTGLRGIPRAYAEKFLEVRGNRFDYEMNILLCAARNNIPITCVPIDTVYMQDNETSNFRAVKDSLLIYWGILKFSLSSLTSALVDISLFTLLVSLFSSQLANPILVATVLARMTSGTMNFTLNKQWVFKSGSGFGREGIKYLALFCTQMLLSWLFVSGIASLTSHVTIAKILVDSGLFFISYWVQKHYVFAPDRGKRVIF